jgi:hypothetical protein
MALVDKIGAIGRHQFVVFDDVSCLTSKVKEGYDIYAACTCIRNIVVRLSNLTDTLIL